MVFNVELQGVTLTLRHVQETATVEEFEFGMVEVVIKI